MKVHGCDCIAGRPPPLGANYEKKTSAVVAAPDPQPEQHDDIQLNQMDVRRTHTPAARHIEAKLSNSYSCSNHYFHC